jgi:dienelactone hydrolase
MKKAMKVIGIIVIIGIIAVFVGIKYLNSVPTPSKDYWSKLETGGEIEKKYLEDGGYDVSYQEDPAIQYFEKYEIWYPTELKDTDRRYPVIVVNNGTGWKASRSKYIYEHYASWGFIVIGNEDGYTWNGFSAEMAIRHLERLNSIKTVGDDNAENIFYQKIDFDNVGVVGHSQGGVGVFNALTSIDHSGIFKTGIALSPTGKELAEGIEWSYEASKIAVPVLLISGEGGGDDWVVTGEGLQAIYDDISAQKVMVRRKNTAHGATQMSADGYVIAWFRWQLMGDTEAAGAFAADGELSRNGLYCDFRTNIE